MQQSAITVDDYGCDPIGDGTFKMVPSGDIVSKEEKEKRLAIRKPNETRNDILGMSWEELEHKQGGRLKSRPE